MVKTCKAVTAFGEYKLKNKEVEKTKIDFDSPFDLFKKIYSAYPNSFLLESMESDSGLARYSVIGFEPTATLKAQNGILEIKKEDETRRNRNIKSISCNKKHHWKWEQEKRISWRSGGICLL